MNTQNFIEKILTDLSSDQNSFLNSANGLKFLKSKLNLTNSSNEEKKLSDLLLSKFSNLSVASASAASIATTTVGAVACAKHINNNDSKTLFITAPGYYKIDHDIHWNDPTPPVPAAIIIASSNVILNLNGHSIIDKSNRPNSVGILLLPPAGGGAVGNVENITIQNGTIKKFKWRGILAQNVSNLEICGIKTCQIGSIQPFPNPGPEGLNMGGIFVTGSTRVLIRKCIVKKTRGSSDGVSGIIIILSDQVKISSCKSLLTENLGGDASGYSFTLVTNLIVQKCLADGVQTRSQNETAPTHTCSGFIPIFSSFLYFENCLAKNIASECDDAHGFPVFICPTTVVLRNCRAETVRDGFNKTTGTGAKANGFEIDITNNVTVTDCFATDIIARNPEDKQCAGFSDGFCTNVSFIRCTSTKNKVVVDASGAGTGGDGGNVGHGDTSSDSTVGAIKETLAYGFGWAPDPRQVFFGPSINTKWLNCISSFNDVGFGLFNHIEGFMENCLIKNCRIGIYSGPTSLTISCNACTECVPPIVTTIENVMRKNIIQCVAFCCNKQNIVDIVPNGMNIYKNLNENCKAEHY